MTAVNPLPYEIIATREAVEITQTAAAALVYSGLRSWHQWDEGDRPEHPARWELFKLKTALTVRLS